MDLGLKGKTAMVAGASKGLGFAVARILSAEGASVSMASRSAESIKAAAARIEGETGTATLGCAVDVRRREDLERWGKDTLDHFGRLDMLFVNSGGPPAGGFLNFDDSAWNDAIALLVMSAVRLSRFAIPVMKGSGGGSIVFSTSSSVKEPIPNLLLSNVLRGSVSALAKTLARDFAGDGIRVNHVIPGRIDTDRLRQLDTINAERSGIPVEEQQRLMAANIPLGRYGAPDEFARAVVFLLSDAASYITGATLQVDGGMIRSVV